MHNQGDAKPRAIGFLIPLSTQELETIYASICKNYTNFDDCCYVAQKHDDNCVLLQSKMSSSSFSMSRKVGKTLDVNTNVDAILRNICQESKN